METHRKRTQTLLVLVPHRDVRQEMRKYSESLFMAGFAGAYLFPWAAPLAVLSRPLNADELKHCARAVREASLSAGDGRINAAEIDITAFPGCRNGESRSALLGLRLDPFLTGDVIGKKLLEGSHTEGAEVRSSRRRIKKLEMMFFSPLIIGACLLPSAEFDKAALPPAPQLSFRAAAAANMIWRPMEAVVPLQGAGGADSGGFGCKWKIGKPCWLAPVRKKS